MKHTGKYLVKSQNRKKIRRILYSTRTIEYVVNIKKYWTKQLDHTFWTM